MDSNDVISKRREEYRKCWRNWKGKAGKLSFDCNPMTAIGAMAIVLGAFLWNVLDPDSHSSLHAVTQWITDTWTWLFVMQQMIWTITVLVIYAKWRHIKLGKEDDVPKYGDYTYFAMSFCTGFSAAKFPSAVDGVITHYMNNGTTMVHLGRLGHDEKAQNAINMNLFLWGFHGSSIFCLPSLLLSFLAYRKGLPATMRSCFYPLLGKSIQGIFGDLVDIIAIVAILFGATVGLNYGSSTIVGGINNQFPDVQLNKGNQIIAIWSMIGIGTVSILTGIGLGIKRLSQLTLSFGICVLLTILLCDETMFLLNVFVQSFGYYFQNVIGLSLHTGAFTQKDNFPEQSADTQDWMHKNTIFFWAWWIALAPLSSIFTARISRGRTIGEVINFTFFVPTLFIFAWFSIIGGATLNMQHNALEAKISCSMYESGERISSMWNTTDMEPYKNIQNLDCRMSAGRLYDLLNGYENVSKFLYFCVIVAIILQFSTQVDSSSYVTDGISSNGGENESAAQKVLWAILLGTSATAFTYFGSANMSSIVIIAACPFLLLYNCSCYALCKVLSKEENWKIPDCNFETDWCMRFGHISDMAQLKKVLLAIVAPWYFVGNIALYHRRRESLPGKIFTYSQFAAPFYLWVIFLFLRIGFHNVDKIGWVFFIAFIAYSVQYRKNLREKSDICGNQAEDFLVLLIYPLAVVQMNEEIVEKKVPPNSPTMSNPAFCQKDHEYCVEVYEPGEIEKVAEEVMF